MTCTKLVEKIVFSFPVGWGEGRWDLQVMTGLNWPFYLSTVSCKQLLSCPAYPSGIPKAHSEDDRDKHKIWELEVDPDTTDMKASIDFK